MRASHHLTLLVTAISLAGCAAPASKYAWGNYDTSLYAYYKDNSKSSEHLAHLESIIRDAEITQGKVAPGMHAEYGYFLMQQGKSNEAIPQFEKEKAKWPESAQLMDSMIKSATTQSGKSPASKE